MVIPQILFFSVVHFALSITTAFVAYGWDLDQVKSRSAISQIAGMLEPALMLPHDIVIRNLSGSSLLQNTVFVRTAVFANSLVSGIILCFFWRLLRGLQELSTRTGSSARGRRR